MASAVPGLTKTAATTEEENAPAVSARVYTFVQAFTECLPSPLGICGNHYATGWQARLAATYRNHEGIIVCKGIGLRIVACKFAGGGQRLSRTKEHNQVMTGEIGWVDGAAILPSKFDIWDAVGPHTLHHFAPAHFKLDHKGGRRCPAYVSSLIELPR